MKLKKKKIKDAHARAATRTPPCLSIQPTPPAIKSARPAIPRRRLSARDAIDKAQAARPSRAQPNPSPSPRRASPPSQSTKARNTLALPALQSAHRKRKPEIKMKDDEKMKEGLNRTD